jgi:hypothetical protein
LCAFFVHFERGRFLNTFNGTGGTVRVNLAGPRVHMAPVVSMPDTHHNPNVCYPDSMHPPALPSLARNFRAKGILIALVKSRAQLPDLPGHVALA